MATRFSLRSIFFALLLTGLGSSWAATDTDLRSEAATLDRLAATQAPGRVTSRFAGDFATFAGSQENAEALIAGLRSGTPITLTSLSATGTVSTTTITPPTQPMGYGNTYISLSLAKAQLASYGITAPTPQELQAALTGGSLTVTRVAADGTVTTETVTLDGILNQRAAGMGWGEIAKANGFKLGEVVSSMKSAQRAVAATGSASDAASTTAPAASRASGQGHAYGRGITTAVSGGGVVYGKRYGSSEVRGVKPGVASQAQGGGAGVGGGRLAAAGVVSAAGGSHGNSANAPGHGKAR